tara:strand:- start:36 stop:1148 length:1113 start_codon:yes stop_codon:yes gene_type:complete
MSKQTIYLATQYRNENTTQQKPTWSLPSTLISNTQDDETLRLTVIDVLIPFNYYNIFNYPNANFNPGAEPTENNILYVSPITVDYSPGGGPASVTTPGLPLTIPMGNYNVFDLSTELTTLATTAYRVAAGIPQAQQTEINVSYNFNTMMYEFNITVPAADGIIIGGLGGGVWDIQIYWLSSDAIPFERTGLGWEVFGANPNLTNYGGQQVHSIFQDPTVIAPAQVVNLLPPQQGNVGLPRTMGIQLDLVSKNVGHDGNGLGYTTTAATIPVNIPNGSLLTYQNINNDFVVDIPSHYLDSLRVTLKTDKGRPFFPNSDWQFSFRIDYIKVDHTQERLLSELIYLEQLAIMGQKELIEVADGQAPNSIMKNK